MSSLTSQAFSGWKMVALCVTTQNLAMGLAFGSFGPLLASTEEHFGVSRTMATMGMSLITLMLGVLSPLLGGIMERISVRTAMIIAALTSAAAYCGIALLSDFSLALVMYALIGAGVSVLAVLGPVSVVNRWYIVGRGKMLGLINLPIVVFIIPFLLAELLPRYGRTTVLLAIAGMFIALVPLLRFLADRPEKLGQVPWRGDGGAQNGSADDAVSGARRQTTEAALRKAPFWLISIGVGIVAGTTTSFVVHIIPFGTERALSPQAAAALLSIYAGAGLLGTPLFGRIVDRLGGPTTLAFAALVQALLWTALLNTSDYALYLVAALLGICAVPVNVLHQAALSELLEPESISRGLGISYAIKLPFIFSFAPAASWFFDRSGGYWLPFTIISSALATAALLFVFAMLANRRPVLSSRM